MSSRRHTYSARLFALRHALVCSHCGVHRDCSLSAILRYTQQGWPLCCGEVMILKAADPANGDAKPPDEHNGERENR